MKRQEQFLIITIGSLWGFSEIVLAYIFKLYLLPFKGALLTGIGIGLTGFLLSILNKKHYSIYMLIIVLIMKLLIIPIRHVYLSCIANSLTAVVIDFVSVYIFYNIFTHRSPKTLFLIGTSGGLGASILFYNIGIHLRPCNYLLSYSGIYGFVRFMIREGVLWGIISGIMFTVFSLFGNMIKKKDMIYYFYEFYYINVFLIIVFWAVSVYGLFIGL